MPALPSNSWPNSPPIIGWDALGITFLPFPIALGAAVIALAFSPTRTAMRRAVSRMVYAMATMTCMSSSRRSAVAYRDVRSADPG